MIKKLLNHKFVVALSVASFFLSLGGFLWALFALKNIGGNIPLVLHFNDLQGITQTGGLGQVVFIGIFMVMVTLLNGWLALAFDEREPFFGKLTAVLTLIFSILLFIGFASIMSVN